MEHWEELKPGGLRFVYDDTLFRPELIRSSSPPCRA